MPESDGHEADAIYPYRPHASILPEDSLALPASARRLVDEAEAASLHSALPDLPLSEPPLEDYSEVPVVGASWFDSITEVADEAEPEEMELSGVIAPNPMGEAVSSDADESTPTDEDRGGAQTHPIVFSPNPDGSITADEGDFNIQIHQTGDADENALQIQLQSRSETNPAYANLVWDFNLSVPTETGLHRVEIENTGPDSMSFSSRVITNKPALPSALPMPPPVFDTPMNAQPSVIETTESPLRSVIPPLEDIASSPAPEEQPPSPREVAGGSMSTIHGASSPIILPQLPLVASLAGPNVESIAEPAAKEEPGSIRGNASLPPVFDPSLVRDEQGDALLPAAEIEAFAFVNAPVQAVEVVESSPSPAVPAEVLPAPAEVLIDPRILSSEDLAASSEPMDEQDDVLEDDLDDAWADEEIDPSSVLPDEDSLELTEAGLPQAPETEPEAGNPVRENEAFPYLKDRPAILEQVWPEEDVNLTPFLDLNGDAENEKDAVAAVEPQSEEKPFDENMAESDRPDHALESALPNLANHHAPEGKLPLGSMIPESEDDLELDRPWDVAPDELNPREDPLPDLIHKDDKAEPDGEIGDPLDEPHLQSAIPPLEGNDFWNLEEPGEGSIPVSDHEIGGRDDWSNIGAAFPVHEEPVAEPPFRTPDRGQGDRDPVESIAIAGVDPVGVLDRMIAQEGRGGRGVLSGVDLAGFGDEIRPDATEPWYTGQGPEGASEPDAVAMNPSYILAPRDEIEVIYYYYNQKVTDAYRFRIGDEFELSFIDTPQYDSSMKVRPDGRVDFPLIGDVDIGGKTIAEVKRLLYRRYEDGVLEDPIIRLKLTQFYTQEAELNRATFSPFQGQNRLTTIRPDGYISVTRLGDVRAAGRTALELSRVIEAGYASLGLDDLNITVNVADAISAVVYVMGDVNLPGEYLLKGSPNAWRAVGQAGGFTPNADRRHVVVARTTDKGDERYVLNFDLWIDYSDLFDNSIIESGDIIWVPPLANPFIYVLGEVDVQASIPVTNDSRLSVSQALVATGRWISRADLTQILVLRVTEAGGPEIIEVDFSEIVDADNYRKKDAHRPIDPVLRPGDTVYVPSKFIGDLNRFAETYFKDGIWTLLPFSTSYSVSKTSN